MPSKRYSKPLYRPAMSVFAMVCPNLTASEEKYLHAVIRWWSDKSVETLEVTVAVRVIYETMISRETQERYNKRTIEKARASLIKRGIFFVVSKRRGQRNETAKHVFNGEYIRSILGDYDIEREELQKEWQRTEQNKKAIKELPEIFGTEEKPPEEPRKRENRPLAPPSERLCSHCQFVDKHEGQEASTGKVVTNYSCEEIYKNDPDSGGWIDDFNYAKECEKYMEQGGP